MSGTRDKEHQIGSTKSGRLDSLGAQHIPTLLQCSTLSLELDVWVEGLLLYLHILDNYSTHHNQWLKYIDIHTFLIIWTASLSYIQQMLHHHITFQYCHWHNYYAWHNAFKFPIKRYECNMLMAFRQYHRIGSETRQKIALQLMYGTYTVIQCTFNVDVCASTG